MHKLSSRTPSCYSLRRYIIFYPWVVIIRVYINSHLLGYILIKNEQKKRCTLVGSTFVASIPSLSFPLRGISNPCTDSFSALSHFLPPSSRFVLYYHSLRSLSNKFIKKYKKQKQKKTKKLCPGVCRCWGQPQDENRAFLRGIVALV